LTRTESNRSEFLPWDAYLDTHYKKPAGVTENPHCFKFVKRDIGNLYYQDYDGVSWSISNLLKQILAPDRQQQFLLVRPLISTNKRKQAKHTV